MGVPPFEQIEQRYEYQLLMQVFGGGLLENRLRRDDFAWEDKQMFPGTKMALSRGCKFVSRIDATETGAAFSLDLVDVPESQKSFLGPLKGMTMLAIHATIEEHKTGIIRKTIKRKLNLEVRVNKSFFGSKDNPSLVRCLESFKGTIKTISHLETNFQFVEE